MAGADEGDFGDGAFMTGRRQLTNGLDAFVTHQKQRISGVVLRAEAARFKPGGFAWPKKKPMKVWGDSSDDDVEQCDKEDDDDEVGKSQAADALGGDVPVFKNSSDMVGEASYKESNDDDADRWGPQAYLGAFSNVQYCDIDDHDGKYHRSGLTKLARVVEAFDRERSMDLILQLGGAIAEEAGPEFTNTATLAVSGIEKALAKSRFKADVIEHVMGPQEKRAFTRHDLAQGPLGMHPHHQADGAACTEQNLCPVW